MYKQMELMAANGLLDGFVMRPGEGILALPLVIFIYRLDCKSTGHYYIGQSHNLKDRLYQHCCRIVDVINESTAAAAKPSPMQKTIGLALRDIYKAIPEGRKKPKVERFCRESLQIYIYAIVGDREAANQLEGYYIRKFSRDKNCLNERWV